MEARHFSTGFKPSWRKVHVADGVDDANEATGEVVEVALREKDAPDIPPGFAITFAELRTITFAGR